MDFNDLGNFCLYWLLDYESAYRVWQWDLDDDGSINNGDLAVISEYWLNPATFYDFADFAQYWRREVDYRFMDWKYDLNSDGFVDLRDFSIFASQWKATTEPIPANIDPTFNQDPNNLSGYVEMRINSITDPNVYKALALIDGKLYADFGDCYDSPKIGIDSQRFVNGNHSVKIVVLYNDMVVCSKPKRITFNNELIIVGSKNFVPGKDYVFYASGSGSYLLQLEDKVNEQIVFSDTYTDEINCLIDANSFPEEYGVYRFSIEKQTGGATAGGFATMATDYEKIFDYIISRNFSKEEIDPNDPNAWRPGMVVSIGSEDLEKDKEQCWIACVRAAVRKNMYPVLLRYEDCSWDNLRFCLLHPTVKLWYHVSHGNHKLLFQPERQCIKSKDGWIFSYLDRNIDPNHLPEGYKKMSGWYENNPSLADLGLANSPKLVWVQFNACYSGHTIQFPWVLGMLRGTWPGDPIGSQVFIGWKESALVYDILGKYNEFEEYYWQYLRQGQNLQTAVMDATGRIPYAGLKILQNFIYYGVIDWQFVWFRYPNIN